MTTVTFTTATEDRAPLVARWGKPRVRSEDEWTWSRSDRTISAQFHDRTATITLGQAP